MNPPVPPAWFVLALGLSLGCGVSATDGSERPRRLRLDTAVGPPNILTGPHGRTVSVGQAATFAVTAHGGALTYEWRRNGVPIAGATGAAYTTPPAGALDDGATFAVTIKNGLGTTTSAPVALTVTRAACLLRGSTGSLTRTTTDGAGRPRTYELLVPPTYPAGAPLAVTFVFHGAGGTAAAARGWGLAGAPGAGTASIFVFPQGIEYQSLGVGWDDTCRGYDMVFFDHMLAELQADYCIDPGRVFAAGFSWGCDFAAALACCRGEVVRGVSAASCSDEFKDPADPATYGNHPCGKSRTAVRFTHDVKGDGAYTAQQFATTSALFRALDGCGQHAFPVSPAPCVAYAGCREPFVECAYPGLRHAVPPGWAADSWAFFSALPQ